MYVYVCMYQDHSHLFIILETHLSIKLVGLAIDGRVGRIRDSTPSALFGSYAPKVWCERKEIMQKIGCVEVEESHTNFEKNS